MYSFHGTIDSKEEADRLAKLLEDELVKSGYLVLDVSSREDTYNNRYNVSVEYAKSAEDIELEIIESVHDTEDDALVWCSKNRPNDFSKDFSYKVTKEGDRYKAVVKTFLMASEWRKRNSK